MKQLILLSISLLITSCNFTSKTKEEFVKPKLFPDNNLIQQELTETLTKKIEFKDTLYVITDVSYGICGNDERFNEDAQTITKRSPVDEKSNLYYLDLSRTPSIHKTNDKVVIIGKSFEHRTFEYKNKAYQIENIKKPIYYCDLQIQHRDTIKVLAIKLKEKNRLRFTLTRNDKLWKAH